MKTSKVVFRKKLPVQKQALGIKEIKDANKMRFTGNNLACRVVVFKPA